MELQPLNVATRKETGKGAAGRLRQAEKLPAVLYGIEDGGVAITIDEHDFKHLVHTKGGEHALIDLTVEDDSSLNCRAMIKEVQHHPIRGHFLHADLMRIDMNKKITTVTPIVLEGHAVGVVNGGVIDHQTREVSIECLPVNMPESIIVNVTDIDIGQNILLRELAVPEGVTILEPADRSIVAVHPPRVVKTAAELSEEELAEGEEGAEGEDAAEGEGE